VPPEKKPHQPRSIVPSLVENLADGDVFSLDGGFTWHICYMHWLQVVSVYTTPRRDDDAPTVRINAEPGTPCLILTCASE
jgi:hypothetical protein